MCPQKLPKRNTKSAEYQIDDAMCGVHRTSSNPIVSCSPCLSQKLDSMTCDASNFFWLHDHDTFEKQNLHDADVDLTVGFIELDSSNQ